MLIAWVHMAHLKITGSAISCDLFVILCKTLEWATVWQGWSAYGSIPWQPCATPIRSPATSLDITGKEEFTFAAT